MNYQSRKNQIPMFELESLTVARHPAVYTDSILLELDKIVTDVGLVLDPFGGTGKLKEIRPNAVCMDIEPEWSALAGLQGDALKLPFADSTFDEVVTSPTYGNRLADASIRDDLTNRSYTNWIRHELHENNSGAMQWGVEYKEFHLAAWYEVIRVLKPNGFFVLNIKDHIRDGEVVDVCGWHFATLLKIGFDIIDSFHVETPGFRMGENDKARIDTEEIYLFRLCGRTKRRKSK